MQNQGHDFKHFVFNLVEHPLVELSWSKYAGIFKVDEVTRSFCLRELQNIFEVSDAHFTVGHDQVQNSQSGSIATRQKNLGSRVDVKMF